MTTSLWKIFVSLIVFVSLLTLVSSGSGIRDDMSSVWAGEDIGYLNPATGMSPGVPAGTALGAPSSTSGSTVPVAGSWSLTLEDGVMRYADLGLSRYGEEVFGYGTMTEGLIGREITAAGSVADSVLDLRLVTMGGSCMYRLDLNVDAGTVRGSYTVYAVGELPRTGSCYGSRKAYPTQAGTSLSGDDRTIAIGGRWRSSGQTLG
ncbi:MAG: hypothetical protein ACXQT2_00710 [Methanotrichaceae archaeon]